MWKPIFTKQNQFIIEKINSIAGIIKEYKIDPNNIGLLGGKSGLLLFLFYYSRYSQNDEFENKGFELLEAIFDSINQQVPSTLYSGGLAGVGWTINHLVNNDFFEVDTNEIFNPADEALYAAMMGNIKNKEYDYLHGALGYGMYFLSSPVSDLIKNYITKVISELENIGIKEGSDKIKWVYPYELKENNKKVYNLGLSHGIASIITFLSKVYEKGIYQNKSKELVTKSVNYLLTQELDPGKFDSYFPAWVEPGKDPQSSRLAWCYGDMGIAVALWQAGKAFQNKLWEEKAIEVLLHNSKRKKPENTLIKDAGICHGSAGVAHIFNRMYHYTGKEAFKEAAIYWFDETLNLAKFEDGLTGYKAWRTPEFGSWQNEYGFLEGIAGIGLTLISAMSDIEPKWDECLLLS